MASSYSVYPTPQAEKDIDRLGRWSERATIAILSLEENPYRGHALKGSLRGVRSLEFSLPGGEYRAAYVVLEAKQACLVFLVGPHEGFYKKAERRYAALRRSGEI